LLFSLDGFYTNNKAAACAVFANIRIYAPTPPADGCKRRIAHMPSVLERSCFIQRHSSINKFITTKIVSEVKVIRWIHDYQSDEFFEPYISVFVSLVIIVHTFILLPPLAK
jgi:hypothetical protein